MGGVSKTLMSSEIQELLKLQCCIKIVSFNVWVRYLVWNFKGSTWNSTQNIMPIHWEICILFTGESLRALRFKSSQITLNDSQVGFVQSFCMKINKANLRDLIAVTSPVILLKLDPNHWFFSPYDIEIWWMTSKNNGAPRLGYINFCVLFQSHQWIQTGVTTL